MKRRRSVLAACALPLLLSPLARAQSPLPRPPPVGELKPLGQDRYQVGRIVVDKRARSFVVPGRVLVAGKPLEYIATSPGGMKDYETLLEVQATGSEFNLACILIGLERDPKAASAQQFRQVPRLAGSRVALQVAWTEGGKRRQVSAAEALLDAQADVKPETVEWVYIGAPASDSAGRFTTDDTGTLVGFVHDANSIIEAAVPIGLGAYGSVRGSALLPPVGTAIELIVQAVSGPK
jgi:hypothetical protein